MIARIHKSMQEKDKGFTLIELLVVIIIIGILASIAIPVFLNQRKKGWDAGVKSDLRNLATEEETYLTEHDTYTDKLADLTEFKQSLPDYSTASAADISLTTYDTASPANQAAMGAGGFCVTGASKSGNTWAYDSLNGGLQAEGYACP